MRDRAPLVHCLTNLVVTNFTANVLLAIGAAPAMVVAREEVGEFAPIANALSINLGTLDVPQTRAIRAAVDAANAAGKPWVLDPVAVGPLTFRTEFAIDLLDSKPAIEKALAAMQTPGGAEAEQGAPITCPAPLYGLALLRRLYSRSAADWYIARTNVFALHNFARLTAACESYGPYCLIGGLAVNCYVEPVYTLDADLVVVSSSLPALTKALKPCGSKLRIQFTTDSRYQEFLPRAFEAEVLDVRTKVARQGLSGRRGLVP